MATYGHQGGYAFNEDQRDAMRDAANKADKTLDRVEAKQRLTRLVDWIYADDSETLPIEEIEADLKAAGVNMERANSRMKALIERFKTGD